MTKPLLAFGLLALAMSIVPTPASAAALTCTAAPIPVGGFVPAPTVPMTLSWLQAGSSCGTPSDLVSIAPPCPTAVTVLPGEYCGPAKPPGMAALCEINPATPVFFGTVLYVGWDINGDGHVLATSGEIAFGPIPPLTGLWAVPNPGVPGRVIAYPTNSAGVGPIPMDANFVICI